MNYIKINPYLRYITKGNLLKSVPSETSEKQQRVDFCEPDREIQLELTDVIHFVTHTKQLRSLLYDTAELLRKYTNSSGAVLHLKNDLKEELIQCPQQDWDWKFMKTQKIEAGKTVAALVAFTRKYVVTKDILEMKICPFGTDVKDSLHKNVFCFPLITPNSNQLIGVIELWKDMNEQTFHQIEIEATLNLCTWLIASIEEDYLEMIRCRKINLHDLLLEIIYTFLIEEQEPLPLMFYILTFLRDAMNAAGLAVSLLKRNELIDEDSYDMIACDANNIFKKTIVYKPEIVNTVTETVIKTRKILKTSDYDMGTYDTSAYFPIICRNMISLPLKYKKVIKAVIEFLTKIDGNCFNYEDEVLCKVALTYGAYFISYDKFLQEKRVKLLSTKVLQNTTDILGAPCVHDLLRMAGEKFILPAHFGRSVRLNLEGADKLYLCFLVREMFLKHAKILAPKKMLTLNYFILLIQRYTTTEGPYNFTHSVRTMYILYYIFIRYPRDFTQAETSEMVLAALCHGIPYSLYKTYFQQDVVVEYFDEEEDKIYLNKPSLLFKNIIKLSRWMIGKNMKQYRIKIERIYRLMTLCPLKYYLEERAILVNLLLEDKFNWLRKTHRNLLMMGLVIVASMHYCFNETCQSYFAHYNLKDDDCVQIGNIKDINIYLRDKERYPPIWLKNQVMYHSLVVLPWVYVIVSIFPKAKKLFKIARKNMRLWLEILNTNKVWIPKHSISWKYRKDQLAEQPCWLIKEIKDTNQKLDKENETNEIVQFEKLYKTSNIKLH